MIPQSGTVRGQHVNGGQPAHRTIPHIFPRREGYSKRHNSQTSPVSETSGVLRVHSCGVSSIGRIIYNKKHHAIMVIGRAGVWEGVVVG